MAPKIGHFNKQSLKNLQKYEMVQGLPQMKDCSETCEWCVLGKHHRDILEAGKACRASKPLELVQIAIVRGNKYFLILKSEVFNIFKKFEAMVNLQSGHQIKKIRKW